MKRILIVEDEEIIRQALKKVLQRQQFDVAEADSVAAALALQPQQFDLVISDLRLPGALGTDLLQRCGDTPVIIMTSYASMRSAIDAMKLGAVDYIAKPFDNDEMLATVQRVLGAGAALSRKRAQKKSSNADSADALSNIIGNSPAMQALYSKIHKVAPTDATVLICGETGTGKELIANAIHNSSPRAQQPMISVNCAAIPETLIEAELFGHEKGAFTGATQAREGLITAADGGTLFLDEIGELPLEAQARLLRVLQESEVRAIGSISSRKVNIRLIAATHRDLRKMCDEKTVSRRFVFSYQCGATQFAGAARARRRYSADRHPTADALLRKNWAHCATLICRCATGYRRIPVARQCARAGQYHPARGHSLRCQCTRTRQRALRSSGNKHQNSRHFTGRLFRAFCVGQSRCFVGNRNSTTLGHQPQKPVGAPPKNGYPAPARRQTTGMNPAPLTTLATLKASARAVAVPFSIALPDHSILLCDTILRLLPEKRIVLRGIHHQQTVLVKLFFDADNWQKEINGFEKLQRAGINTPALLTQCALEQGGVCLFALY
jgi:CheY-like chemotaxis protein